MIWKVGREKALKLRSINEDQASELFVSLFFTPLILPGIACDKATTHTQLNIVDCINLGLNEFLTSYAIAYINATDIHVGTDFHDILDRVRKQLFQLKIAMTVAEKIELFLTLRKKTAEPETLRIEKTSYNSIEPALVRKRRNLL